MHNFGTQLQVFWRTITMHTIDVNKTLHDFSNSVQENETRVVIEKITTVFERRVFLKKLW